jgi:hypothetical protein
MKTKLFISSAVLILFTLMLFAANAKAEVPKGLLDRGPLTKITFIHYKKAFVKPPSAGGGKSAKCYGFLANGAKWKTNEPYYINPTGSGTDSSLVESAVSAGTVQWENYGGNIFGDGYIDTNASYNGGSYDEKNTVSFGGGLEPGIIAVTNIWGFFGGAPSTRELVEWDLLFNNSAGWTWGDGATNSALMDVQNIATHEVGHAAGMGDLYETSCNLETMFGYSTEGETIKRNLNNGDIKGIQTLY